MQKIPLSLAEPGMTLAKAVVREDGITLVGEGTELSETLLARFEQSGISSVTVKGSPVDMSALPGGTDFTKRADRLPHLFRKHGEERFMLALQNMLAQYFTLKAAAMAAEMAAEEAAENEEAEDTNGTTT